MALKLIQAGYKVTAVAKTLGIFSSSLYYKNKPRLKKNRGSDMILLEKIKRIVSSHPFWCYLFHRGKRKQKENLQVYLL